MPKMRIVNRGAITVYGTEAFLNWVKEVRPELYRWGLSELNHHPNAYTVEFEDQNVEGYCFIDNFEKIFQIEVGAYVYQGEKFPEVSLELYRKWFRYEYHECVYDLSSTELSTYDDEN